MKGVIVSWPTNIQSSITVDSTDTKLKIIYSAVKKVTSHCQFLIISSIDDLIQLPITMYADNQAAISIPQDIQSLSTS